MRTNGRRWVCGVAHPCSHAGFSGYASPTGRATRAGGRVTTLPGPREEGGLRQIESGKPAETAKGKPRSGPGRMETT
jgi:hypothetical protein